MTYTEWRKVAIPRLEAGGITPSDLTAAVIFSRAAGVPRERLVQFPDEVAPDEHLLDMLDNCVRGVPMSYVVGAKEFYGRMFAVRPGVFIPRPETELLVEAVARAAPKNAVVADVGAGTGAIGLTLKLERPDVQVIATDVSPDALACVVENANLLDASTAVIRANLLAAFRRESLNAVVSNPPYIDPLDPRVDAGVRDYEPHLALFSPGGLRHIEDLIDQASRVLVRGGLLAFEFGAGQRTDVERMLDGWDSVRILKDLAGHDRIALANRRARG
jgi:release factor glutamine methyltransferase